MAEADICKGRVIMNEETIDYRLTQIEKKLDTVTDLLLQTQAQEIRLSNAEKAIRDLGDKKEKNIQMWLSSLISAIVSGIVAFIFIKVGLK
jgi:membrane-bound ClpP family serine protease